MSDYGWLCTSTAVVYLVTFIAWLWLFRKTRQPRWIVGGLNGTELEAKNQAQAKEIAGYICLIEAAKEIGVSFWWEGRTAKAEYGQLRRRETWPQRCHLCNHDMESDTDRTEWHGLGNCVSICPTCSGSGTAEEIAQLQKPETVFEAARRLIEIRAELMELEKHVDGHEREEFSSCEKCESFWVKKGLYCEFALDWAQQFALFVGGMRTNARDLTVICSDCGKETTIKFVRSKDTAEGGCATQASTGGEGGAA